MGAVGTRSDVAGAKNSLDVERSWEPRGAEIRSGGGDRLVGVGWDGEWGGEGLPMQVLRKVLFMRSAGMESSVSWMISGDRA